MTRPQTAIVVGGGLIGCCSAYYLAKRGLEVALLERDKVGSGASSGNCGFICPSHVLPMAAPGVIGHTLRQMLSRDGAVSFRWRALPGMLPWLIRFLRQCNEGAMLTAARARHELLRASVRLYRELIDQCDIDCEWRDRGLLVAYRSPTQFELFAKKASLLRSEFGLQLQRYSGDDVRALEPALRPEVCGAWHFPADSHVRPDKLLNGLASTLRRNGVTINEGVDVQRLVIEGGQLRQIVTAQGEFRADVVVVATGAESPQFARALGCRIPIQPGKGYSLTMPATPRSPKFPIIFDDHHVAVTPFDNAIRIGSTMEFAGYDRSINHRRVKLLVKSAQAHLVEVPDDRDIQPWAGWRPMTYDGLPCIDRAPAAANVVIAAGNGMIGLASAPATGKLAAEMATGADPHMPQQAFSLSRFR